MMPMGSSAGATIWRDTRSASASSNAPSSADKSNFSMAASCRAGDSQVLCANQASYATTALKVENTFDLALGAWDGRVVMGGQLTAHNSDAASSLGPMPSHPEGQNKMLGLYAQGEFTLNDKLTLTPGIRVDFGQFSPSTASIANGAAHVDNTAISLKIAALYKLNDSVSVFGSVAHTERMPTIDELYQYNTVAGRVLVRTASTGLRKKQADTIELGLAVQREGIFGADDSVQVKLTGFHNNVTDKIATRPASQSTPGLSYYDNIAAAEIWGIELEAGYDAQRWFGQLAYANIKSKDKSTGLTLADTPSENVALTLGAKLPGQNLVIGWRWAWHSAITTASASTTAGSYDSHDVFATWSPDKGALAGLSVNFTVENLFDADYRNNLSLDNGAGRNAKISIGKTVTW